MIVPQGGLPPTDGQSPLLGEAPSDTNLLMAAAEMHKRGRLVQSGGAGASPQPRQVIAMPKRPRPRSR